MPSSTPHASFEDDLIAIAALATRPVASAAELQGNLGEVYKLAVAVDLSRYDVGEILAKASALQRVIFELRLDLKSRVEGWQTQGFMTRPVQRAIRDVLRVARYANDIIGEIAAGHPHLAAGEKTKVAFTGQDGETLVNRKFPLKNGEVEIRSGDVMLVRGMLHNSAAIARIGDIDSQFSHICVVHIDPKTGKQSVVEALIEEGSLINTWEHATHHGLGRAALFRHHDQALAARAADEIFAHVARSRAAWANHIYYDFTMLLDSYKLLFCSKLIRLAFDKASKGTYLLPTYNTRFEFKNRDFIEKIGVKAVDTFAPGDIEIEPGFDLVAEWQDYRVTSRLRLQDLLMTKLFDWMEQDNLKFRPDWGIWLIGIFGRVAGALSERAKDAITNVLPKIPSNMTRTTIATVAMLHKTAEPILVRLQKKEEDNIVTAGLPLEVRKIYAELEAIRAESPKRIGYLVAGR